MLKSLRLLSRSAVVAATERRIDRVVDRLRNEPHRAVAKCKLSSARVIAAEGQVALVRMGRCSWNLSLVVNVELQVGGHGVVGIDQAACEPQMRAHEPPGAAVVIVAAGP